MSVSNQRRVWDPLSIHHLPTFCLRLTGPNSIFFSGSGCSHLLIIDSIVSPSDTKGLELTAWASVVHRDIPGHSAKLTHNRSQKNQTKIERGTKCTPYLLLPLPVYQLALAPRPPCGCSPSFVDLPPLLAFPGLPFCTHWPQLLSEGRTADPEKQLDMTEDLHDWSISII